jgi:hypothetical protein
VWSLAFRRSGHPQGPTAVELGRLIQQGRATLIGPVRQELLSGIRDMAQFNLLRDTLRAFPDLVIGISDYEQAAAFFNRCRSHGVQGTHIDFLLCAVLCDARCRSSPRTRTSARMPRFCGFGFTEYELVRARPDNMDCGPN